MSDSHGRFCWYELLTTDTAAAKQFYGSVVGWSMQDAGVPGMDYTLLNSGKSQIGGVMELPKEARDKGVPPGWVGYVFADDLDATATKLQQLGGKVHRPATDIPDVGRFAAVSDPQGASFNLFHSSQPGEPSPPNTIGHVGWHELHSSDWLKGFDFYHALFNWQKSTAVDMRPMGIYQLFKIGNRDAGGMFNSPAAGHARFWLYYFIVPAINAAAQRVTAGGGKIMQGPMQVPGGGWILQASDPQGAMFALTSSEA